jgi:hypothetical protein
VNNEFSRAKIRKIKEYNEKKKSHLKVTPRKTYIKKIIRKKELSNQDSSTPKFKTEKVLTFIIKILFN